ncbi:uncharacterized, partial [Tachysurus ichikawai]
CSCTGKVNLLPPYRVSEPGVNVEELFMVIGDQVNGANEEVKDQNEVSDDVTRKTWLMTSTGRLILPMMA